MLVCLSSHCDSPGCDHEGISASFKICPCRPWGRVIVGLWVATGRRGEGVAFRCGLSRLGR